MAQIKDYTEKTTLVGTEEWVLQNTGGGVTQKATTDTLASYINEPIGTIKDWDKSFPSTPALTSLFKECDGSLISDSDSPYNGYRIRNLNGANVVLTLTWTADAGGSYATVAATDLTALGEGDDVSGTGIAANSTITDITGTTVTISDAAATGSISSTFTNDGDFVRGSSSSGVGKLDAMQRITGKISTGGATGNLYVEGAFTTQTGQPGQSDRLNQSATVGTERVVFDSANSTSPNNAKTDDNETYPKYKTMVKIMKIK